MVPGGFNRAGQRLGEIRQEKLPRLALQELGHEVYDPSPLKKIRRKFSNRLSLTKLSPKVTFGHTRKWGGRGGVEVFLNFFSR